MSEATLTHKEYELGELTEENMQYEPEPLFDEFGNPTPETLEAFYESEHGLTEEISLEDLKALIHAYCSDD